MNPKLTEISKRADEDLESFIAESEDKLLEAWHQCEAEAQEQETKPKFRMAFTVTLDLDGDKMETALTFGVRHKLSRDQSIPDPDQQNFDGALKEDVTTVRFTPAAVDVLKQAAAELRKA